MIDELLDIANPSRRAGTGREIDLASIDRDAERTYAGLGEAIADPNTAVAVIGMLTRHLAITMVGRHGEGAGPARAEGRSSLTRRGEEADK